MLPVEGPGCQAHGTTNSPGGFPRLLAREKLAQLGPSSGVSAKKFAPHNPSSDISAKKFPQRGPSSRISAKKFAQRGIKHPFWAIFRVLGELFRAYTMTTVPQGELFRARTHIRPSRATNVAPNARQHGDIETTNTTAHPQQGTTETRITSARANCTKNAHFPPAKAMTVSVTARPAPAKAMVVSTPHRHQRAKATRVSENRATWSVGPGGDTHERRRWSGLVLWTGCFEGCWLLLVVLCPLARVLVG